MASCCVLNVTSTEYLSIIGYCLHIAQVSRPGFAYAVDVLSLFSYCHGKPHTDAALAPIPYTLISQTITRKLFKS
jgi:hypothetical protein